MENNAKQIVRDWLKANERNLSWLGRQIPASRITVHRWLVGDTRPSVLARKRLAELVGNPTLANQEAWE